jgi:glycosyltransferase involved in cell wall biosynthesis
LVAENTSWRFTVVVKVALEQVCIGGTVQVHNLPDFLVFAALAPKLTRTPVILDLHDLMPELFASRLKVGMYSWLVRLLARQERSACRFADHVITVTERWRKTLVERGVSADKVSVTVNIADLRLFNRFPTPLLPRNGGGFRLLYRGTFTHRYGVDLIIRALAVVGSDLPDVRLALLGDGETRSELLNLAASTGVTDRVEFSKGVVAAEELSAAIATVHVGIVPNRSNIFTDGILPTKLLEFVAMGTPGLSPARRALLPTSTTRWSSSLEPGSSGGPRRQHPAFRIDHIQLKTLGESSNSFNGRYPSALIAAQYVQECGSLAVVSQSSGTDSSTRGAVRVSAGIA